MFCVWLTQLHFANYMRASLIVSTYIDERIHCEHIYIYIYIYIYVLCSLVTLSWRAAQANKQLPFPDHSSAAKYQPAAKAPQLHPHQPDHPPPRFAPPPVEQASAAAPHGAASSSSGNNMPIPPPPQVPPPVNLGPGLQLVGQQSVNGFAMQAYGQGMFQMSAYMLQTLAREFGQQMRESRQPALAYQAPPLMPQPMPPQSSCSSSTASEEEPVEVQDEGAGKDDEAFFVFAAMHVC